jgi:hypothetical protein
MFLQVPKLINELVKAMETALKSDDGYDKELKRLEYKLPLFNTTLKANHKVLVDKIQELNKEDIANMVPEATMVSTYMEIKKLVQTKEASKNSFAVSLFLTPGILCLFISSTIGLIALIAFSFGSPKILSNIFIFYFFNKQELH